jgi:bifunctional DNA-binding transcriptional regulator/antitoxin component of YhaV-PrlF toxin-antitoxin module
MVVPVEIRKRLGLKPGVLVLIELRDGVAVIRKVAKSWTELGAGLARGVWGAGSEESSAWLRRERRTWQRKSSA